MGFHINHFTLKKKWITTKFSQFNVFFHQKGLFFIFPSTWGSKMLIFSPIWGWSLLNKSLIFGFIWGSKLIKCVLIKILSVAKIVLSEPFSGRKIFCMRQENYAVRHLMFSSVFLAFLVVSLLFSQWTLMLNPEILSFSGERRTKFEWTRKTQDFRVKYHGQLRKM